MTVAEQFPDQNAPENGREQLPHFSIQGFELLNVEQRRLFLNIPPSHLEAARPMIEREIQAAKENRNLGHEGLTEIGAGENEREYASAQEYKANIAIDTFHRAEKGDPQAKKDLLDQKKELFGEEPNDEELFKTILESESSDPFAQDMAMEVLLTDREAETTQKVFDLFKNYRGDLASVDDALPASEQLVLFLALSKGQGSLRRRFDFVETVLDQITKDGTVNLFEALNERKLLKDHRLVEPRLEEMAEGWQQNAEHLVN